MDENALVKKGSRTTVAFAQDAAGNFPAREDLEKIKFTAKDMAKFASIVELIADSGTCVNTQKFKKERGDIFAIKGHQLRVGCFWDPTQRGVLLLTHAFKKKKDQWPNKELERAERIRKEHLDRKQRSGRAQ